MRHGKDACSQTKNIRADKVEPAVWEFVSDLLEDPERLRVGLDEMIEQERNAVRTDPKREAEAWLVKLAELNEQRSRAQDLAIEGLLDHDELRAKLAALEEARETVQRELEALRGHRERIEQLERNRDALMENYAEMVPEALDALSTEERHQIYKMLRLKVVARGGERFEVSGALGNVFSTLEPTPRRWVIEKTFAWLGQARRLEGLRKVARDGGGYDLRGDEPAHAAQVVAARVKDPRPLSASYSCLQNSLSGRWRVSWAAVANVLALR